MMKLPRQLSQIRFSDVALLDQLSRLGSAAAVARVQGTTTSHVTKTCRRLEAAFGEPLVDHGPTGTRLNAAGMQLLQELLPAITRLSARDTGASRRVTAAAPSYLAPPLLGALAEVADYTVRAVELSQSMLAASLPSGVYDFVLAHGDLTPNDRYASVQVGWAAFGLFASAKLAQTFGKRPITPAQARALTYVRPIHRIDEAFYPGDDGCPLPANERSFGHEVQTMDAALDLVSRTKHVVFGPALAAAGRPVVEVAVEGWSKRLPLRLFAHADRVKAAQFRAVAKAIEEALPGRQPALPRR